MTAPAITIRPSVHVYEDARRPNVVGDLWAASGAPILGERIRDGIEVWPSHGGATGTWPLPCSGTVPDPDASKAGSRAESVIFPAVVIWAADECSTVGNSEQRAYDLASATLDLDARHRLEEHYIRHVITDTEHLTTVTAADPPADIKPVAMALGALEHRIRRWGHTGVVHASDELLPAMHTAGLVRWDGDTPRTPGGSVWAFGSGYADALGTDTLIATGPTSIYLSETLGTAETDPRQNIIYAVRERIAAVVHTDTAYRVVLT